MAIGATILIKRTAGVSSLPTLRYGEIAVSISTGTYSNQGGRLWIGDEVGNPIAVGGRYYADLLTVQPGIASAGKALILDGSGQLNSLNVGGNVSIGGSLIVAGVTTFSSQDGFTLDAIGITSNVISTKAGSGNKLYLDPYPTGSNDGTVIIKGNLEVYGSTSNVNSRTVTVEESILALSDPTSIRLIVGSVGVGTNVITLDSVVGINTGDVVRNVNGLPLTDALRKITSYNPGNNTVSIAGTVSAGISSGTEITVVYGWDTQTNRGVSFTYNDDSVGLGTTASLTGFFGFQDYNKRFTFVPNATIGVTTSTGIRGYVSGTKGYLDIKGIYYQLEDTSTNGVVYFDGTGLMNSTTSPGSGITTSNYILTTQPGTNVPVWTSTIDGGEY
jgi:hypothetical protein